MLLLCRLHNAQVGRVLGLEKSVAAVLQKT